MGDKVTGGESAAIQEEVSTYPHDRLQIEEALQQVQGQEEGDQVYEDTKQGKT